MKQFIIHVGDYVELFSGQFVFVKHIYTYCTLFDKSCQVFMFVQPLQKAPYRDEIFGLDIFQSTKTDQIVPLFSVRPAKLYFVPINQSKNNPIPAKVVHKIDLLHCDWNINFFWISSQPLQRLMAVLSCNATDRFNFKYKWSHLWVLKWFSDF